jgi:hypothetical protein
MGETYCRRERAGLTPVKGGDWDGGASQAEAAGRNDRHPLAEISGDVRTADSRVYEGACAAIRSSSVADTMRAQEELLEQGPFGWDRVPVSPARRWTGAPDQPSPCTSSDGDDAFPRKRGDVFVG